MIVKQQDWYTKRTCEKFSRVQKVQVFKFSRLLFSRFGRENLDLAKISRYTVYVDRGGGGSPIERTHFANAFFVSNQEQYVF